jgi:hypothetical protein
MDIVSEHWDQIPQAHEDMRLLSDNQKSRFGCCQWCRQRYYRILFVFLAELQYAGLPRFNVQLSQPTQKGFSVWQ